MGSNYTRILLIDSNRDLLDKMKASFANTFEIDFASNGSGAIARLRSVPFHVVIITDKLSDTPLNNFLSRLDKLNQGLFTILISENFEDLESCNSIETDLIGEYFIKPINLQALRASIVVAMRADNHEERPYDKVRNLLDQVRHADKARKEYLLQLKKVRKLEIDATNKVNDYTHQFKSLKRQIELLMKQRNSFEEKLISLSKYHETEKEQIRKQINILTAENDSLIKENAKSVELITNMKSTVSAEKDATMRVSSTLARRQEKKRRGRPSILFVDDEKDLREIVEDKLKSIYHVYLAASGKEAIKIVSEHPTISLVLTDCKMPGMDGIELSKKIRATNPDIPIYLLTSFAEENNAIRAMNTGDIDKYFKKPFRADQMKLEIQRGIEQFDLDVGQREIVSNRKEFIVEKVERLEKQIKIFEKQNERLKETNKGVHEKYDQRLDLMKQLEKQNDQLKVAAMKERTEMRAEIRREKLQHEKEINIKREEADQMVEIQKAKYGSELEEMQTQFEVEKNRLEADHKNKREKLEKEISIKKQEDIQILEALREQMSAEKVDMNRVLNEKRETNHREIETAKNRMAVERTEMDRELNEKREANRREIEVANERMATEIAKREEDFAALKEAANNEKMRFEKRVAEEKMKTEQQVKAVRAELESKEMAFKEELNTKRRKAETEIKHLLELKETLFSKKNSLEKQLLSQREEAEMEIAAMKKELKLKESAFKKELDAKRKEAEDEIKQLLAVKDAMDLKKGA